MKICMFYHSLVSDWNHGNAHFLRGIATELMRRSHQVVVYEPANGWSASNLIAEHGEKPLKEFHAVYPHLQSTAYDPGTFNLDSALSDADMVIVHEWNDPEMVSRIGACRKRHGFTLFFHDTHHRAVTARNEIQRYDLSNYHGVLAYGKVLRDIYLTDGFTRRAWTWHEAADTSIFKPVPQSACNGDLVWIGNWGDGERSDELNKFLIEPITSLALKARIHGVRYPEEARATLSQAGIEYGGWLPNYYVPKTFARFQITVHIPRRPYVKALPGIPTIRPFEAMACGIPLVCSPWRDVERLFTPGKDFLIARNGSEMKLYLKFLLGSENARRDLAEHALSTIRARHTCAHRVDELLQIFDDLRRRMVRKHSRPLNNQPVAALTL